MIDHDIIKLNMIVRLVKYRKNPSFFDQDEKMLELCQNKPIVIIDEIQDQTNSGYDETLYTIEPIALYTIEPIDRELYPETYQDYVWRGKDLEKVNTFVKPKKRS